MGPVAIIKYYVDYLRVGSLEVLLAIVAGSALRHRFVHELALAHRSLLLGHHVALLRGAKSCWIIESYRTRTSDSCCQPNPDLRLLTPLYLC